MCTNLLLAVLVATMTWRQCTRTVCCLLLVQLCVCILFLKTPQQLNFDPAVRSPAPLEAACSTEGDEDGGGGEGGVGGGGADVVLER